MNFYRWNQNFLSGKHDKKKQDYSENKVNYTIKNIHQKQNILISYIQRTKNFIHQTNISAPHKTIP